jgi:methionyl-tRNA formyltransferase
VRIVFIGTVKFSRIMLEKVVDEGGHVVGVITKQESAFNSDFEDLSTFARDNNIPFLYVKDINHEDSVSWINQLKPDIIFCFGWSNLIKMNVLEIPPFGVIGFHPALLPSNKGRHPLIWAKVLGLKKSGTTFFFMDEGADTGDILDQMQFDITFDDDAFSLYKKMTQNALLQVERFLPQLQAGNFNRIKQTGIGNTWRKRDALDGLIDFRMSSEAICNLIRGLTKPYVGAHCIYKGREIKVWEAELSHVGEVNSEPGKVLCSKNGILTVKTFDGAITLTKHDFQDLPTINTYIK